MTDERLAVHNAAKLAEINRVIRPKFKAVLVDLQGHGLRPRIQCAGRTKREQMEAFRSGHSKVTWGFHNALNSSGAFDALAADVVDDDAPLKPSEHFVELLHRAAEAHGLGCPIPWDRCHVEYVKLSIAAARRGERPRPEDL